jgi:hypothetical protein
MALLTKAELVMTLLNASSAEQRARWKHSVEDPEPPSGKDEPKIPIVPKESAAVTRFKEDISKL